MAQLTFQKINLQVGEPTYWTPELIQWLKEVDNRVSRVVEVWLDNILGGYIIDFAINTVKSYSDTERKFFQGLRGRFLLSLQLWIKMFICGKGILKMKLDE